MTELNAIQDSVSMIIDSISTGAVDTLAIVDTLAQADTASVSLITTILNSGGSMWYLIIGFIAIVALGKLFSLFFNKKVVKEVQLLIDLIVKAASDNNITEKEFDEVIIQAQVLLDKWKINVDLTKFKVKKKKQ